MVLHFYNLVSVAGYEEVIALQSHSALRRAFTPRGRFLRRLLAALVSEPLWEKPVVRSLVPFQPEIGPELPTLRLSAWPCACCLSAPCPNILWLMPPRSQAALGGRAVYSRTWGDLFARSVGGTSPVGGALSGSPPVGDPGLECPSRGAQGTEQALSPCHVQKAPVVMAPSETLGCFQRSCIHITNELYSHSCTYKTDSYLLL